MNDATKIQKTTFSARVWSVKTLVNFEACFLCIPFLYVWASSKNFQENISICEENGNKPNMLLEKR